MFYSGFDALFSILFPLVFLVLHDPVYRGEQPAHMGQK